MAGGRTKDHRKTSAKTKRNSSEQCHKDTVRLSSSQLTWPFSDSKTNAVYRELDVAELHWPAEDERELSQEIVRVNPLNRHSILQVFEVVVNENLVGKYEKFGSRTYLFYL